MITRRTIWSQRLAAHRRVLAMLLAVLWSLYAILGAASDCLAVRLDPSSTQPSISQLLVTSKAVCHCQICGMAMHGSKCLCCGHTQRTADQITVCQGRCDQGAPATIAAVQSWPVIEPSLEMTIVHSIGTLRALRASHQYALSHFLIPPTQPPSLV